MSAGSVAAGPKLLDVARAAGLYGDRPAGSAGDRVNDAVVGDDARTDVAIIVAVAAPQLLARGRVDADDLARPSRQVQHQLRFAARDLDQHGRTPGTACAGELPGLGAVRLVEGHQCAAFNARVDDHEVVEEQRRRGRAPTGGPLADALGPDLFSRQVKAKQTRLAEEDEQVLAVADRRAGSVAVLAVVAGLVARLGQLRLHALGPADGPGLPVEADQVPHQVLLVAGVARRLGVAAVAGNEDRIADRDRARGSRPRQLGLPDDALRLGPFLGKSLVVAD